MNVGRIAEEIKCTKRIGCSLDSRVGCSVNYGNLMAHFSATVGKDVKIWQKVFNLQ